jgi:CRISPR-associated protein Csy1
LLSSAPPPKWQSKFKPLYHKHSAFDFFEKKERVKLPVQELLSYLESDPSNTMDTRNKRDAIIDWLLDELVQFALENIQQSEHGWSKNENCKLQQCEQCWLDPFRVLKDEGFNEIWQSAEWVTEVAKFFSNWLNDQLSKKLPVGDPEFEFWLSKCISVLEKIHDWQKEKIKIFLLEKINIK